MKAKKYITPLIFALLCLTTACDFLELESPNDINADNLFKDAASAENALIGVYSSLQSPSYYGGNYLLIGEPISGNSATGGFDNSNIDELGAQAVTPSNIIVEEMWYGIYNTIANANHLIEGLETIDDSAFDPEPDRKNEIEGQARAIRAMAHFDLLRYFGEHWDNASSFGIPVISTVQKIGDIAPRSTVAQTYTFILGELNAALALVNQVDRDPAFVNSGTVHALLARVYLYNKDYPDAITHADETASEGLYILLDDVDYPSIFNDRQTSESIFELAFDSQNRSRYNGLTYARPDALNTEVNFLAAEALSDFFISRPGDVRADLADFDPGNNDTSIQPNGRSQKYRGESDEDSPAYIFRFAEIFLIRAEALGYSAAGLADLNTIRNMRGLGLIDPGAGGFLSAILDERKAEFNFEGHYYFDLARAEEIKPGGLLDIDAFRAILPIPLREITATKGAVEQNPGYE